MDHAVVGQLVNQNTPNSPPITKRHRDVNIVPRDETTSTGWMKPFPIEVRDVLIVIVNLGKEQDYVLAMLPLPGRSFERTIDVRQGVFCKEKDPVGRYFVQSREQKKFFGAPNSILAS